MRISLNNRHKAGIFLTAVVAGLCLIMGVTVSETAGAVIIGAALIWAFGSTSRVLRYCIGGLGILLFLVPFIAELIDHHDAMQSYESSLDIFRAQLPQFARDHHEEWFAENAPTPGEKTYLDDNGNPITSSRILVVPNIGNVSFPRTMSDKDIAKALRSDSGNSRAPDWYLEALDAGVSPDDINQITPPLDKPKPFDLKHVISDSAVIEVPSAMLAILFFGSVIAERKRVSSRSNSPVES